MAFRMLVAYYNHGRDSWGSYEGLENEKSRSFEEYLNQYDIIFLNIQQFLIEVAAGKKTEYLEEVLLIGINYGKGDWNKNHSCGWRRRWCMGVAKGGGTCR